MSRFLFLLSLLITFNLQAQQAKYQLSSTFGLAGLNGNTLEAGVFTGASLDRVRPLTKRTDLLLGLGAQHSSYEVGANEQPCDFPLGDKIVTFSFNETYEFNGLDGVLRLGAQHRLGKLQLRGLLLPTLRLYDRITSTYVIDFDQIGRPNDYAISKVRPGATFDWTDGTTRVLRYNSVFQLRAGAEIDFALNKQLGVGLGYQAGLTKYILTNYYQFTRSSGELVEVATTEEDARTAQGYLVLRIRL